MSKSRFELKVGVFVFISLALVAALMLQFRKGRTLFQDTYEIRLKATNIGGVKKNAAVLMSGVQIGQITDIRLSPTGTNVTIFAEIFGEYKIYTDARFRIEQSGFLGDQYVAVVPTRNEGKLLRPPDNEVQIEEPFNLQEVARSAGGFIKRIEETANRLNETVMDVRLRLLNEETLTNLSTAAINTRVASERALGTLDRINALVDTNAPSLGTAVSNVVFFSDQINILAESLGGVIETNSVELASAMKNLESTTLVVKQLVDDLDAGRGLAGTLIRNETLSANVQQIARNLSITTSNLNRVGLWGILWSKRPERSTPDRSASNPVQSPKAESE